MPSITADPSLLRMPNILGAVNAGVDRGNQIAFNRLAGQYVADPSSNSASLGQAAQIDPMNAMRIQGAVQDQQAQQVASEQAQQLATLKKIGGPPRYMAAALQSNNPAIIDGAWQTVRPIVEQLTGKPTPESWDPAMEPALYKAIAATSLAFPEDNKLYVLNAGAKLANGQGQVIASSPAKPANPQLVGGMQIVTGPDGVAQYRPVLPEGAYQPESASFDGPDGQVKFDFAPGTPQSVIDAAHASAQASGDLPPTGELQSGQPVAVPQSNGVKTLDQVLADRRKASSGASGSKAASPVPDLLNDDAIQASAWRQILTGDSGIRGYGKEAVQERAKIANTVAKIAKDTGVSPQELATTAGRNKALQSSLTNLQKQSDVVQKSEQAFQNNMDYALQLSSQLDRTGSPVLNKWILGGKAAIGDPQVAALDAAISTASADYARIMAGQTGAAGTPIYTMEDAKNFLRKELSHKSLEAVTQTLYNDIQGQQSALDGQRQRILDAMREFGSSPSNVSTNAAQNQPWMDDLAKYGAK